MSGGTSASVTVALPVYESSGSMTRVYVPVIGATFTSVKYAANGYTAPLLNTATPSGRSTWMCSRSISWLLITSVNR
jgi:hypothetical protein